MRAPSHHRYTRSEYLSLESASSTKHEYLDGEIFALAGGTPEHSALATAAAGELRALLEGRPCRVYNSDLRIRVQASGLTTYPDVSIICGELRRDPGDRNTVINPVLVLEVTSDSTESYDRGEKLEHMRRIDSLQEYVLVSHREALIEVFRRGADTWTRSEPAPVRPCGWSR